MSVYETEYIGYSRHTEKLYQIRMTTLTFQRKTIAVMTTCTMQCNLDSHLTDTNLTDINY